MPKSSPSSNSSRPRNAESPSNRPGRARLGLIAGNGEFPLLVAEAAKVRGLDVVAVAFPEETEPRLAGLVDEIHWTHVGQLSKMIRIFKAAGVRRAVMAGQIKHWRLFADVKPDWRAAVLLAGLRDKRADSILSAVADHLRAQGIVLESPLPLLREHMAPGPGCLTKRRPTAAEKQDIEFGYRLAKHVAGVDIGQTVVVKNRAVIAVEAMEGTDACIERGGRLARGGAVVVKVGKPKQDLRFDMPVVGLQTIANLKKSGIRALAFDSGTTLILRKAQTLAAAERAGISLIAL